MKIYVSSALLALLFMLFAVAPQNLYAGALEVPGDGASVSGRGSISGWHCSTDKPLQWRVDRGPMRKMPHGFEREDTRDICGDADNGFQQNINWNTLGEGEHFIDVFAGAELLGSATVYVSTYGEEFLSGIKPIDIWVCTNRFDEVEKGTSFPGPTALTWDEGPQNFVITFTDTCDEIKFLCPNRPSEREQELCVLLFRCCL